MTRDHNSKEENKSQKSASQMAAEMNARWRAEGRYLEPNPQEDGQMQVVFFKKNPKPPEKIKTLVPLLKLLSIPAGAFVVLLITPSLWAAFIVGALILLLTRAKMISKEIQSHEMIPKPEIPQETIKLALLKLLMYAILFYYIFIPMILYVQQKYKIPLVDNQTYNYFTSQKYGN